MREFVKYLLGIVIILTIIYTVFISYNVLVFINSDESKITIEDYSESMIIDSQKREALEELFNSENLKNSSNYINLNYDGTPVSWVLRVEKALLGISYDELEDELLRNSFISFDDGDFILIGPYIDRSKLLLAQDYFNDKYSLFKEKVNFKLPGGGAFKPHQDFPAWTDLPPKDYITIGIPLDNMTIENGCLYMASGQGRNKEIYHNKLDNKISKELIESWTWHPVVCKKGDILVFDSFVPHYSEINKTHNSRRIYYFTYNIKSEGVHRNDYFNKKRELFPQHADKIPGKDYSVIGAKYNLGNPINSKV